MITRPKLTEDIMSTRVVVVEETDSLAHAHSLMKENHIRHLPVVDGNGEYSGLVTQKEILRHAFAATAQSGLSQLQEIQSQVLVKEIMANDVETIQPQLPLLNAGEYFVESKHGCLPVVVEGKLVGILTSADFVKLSLLLLRDASDS